VVVDAVARMGLNRKQPMHETRSLAHANEAERAIDVHHLRVEADTVVGDGKPKLAALHLLGIGNGYSL
jgi:hypothetical protein